MRDLKFRAWHKELKQMFWFDIMWGNRHNSGSGYIGMLPIEVKTRSYSGGICGNDNRFEVDPNNCELMQFTGLKDKNGVEIYEGDILKFTDDRIYGNSVITLHIDNFFEGDNSYTSKELQRTEVYGNIYENPELLKG